jgi:hypothetical protein
VVLTPIESCEVITTSVVSAFELAAFGGTLFDRINRIYGISIFLDNPVHPV